MILCDKKEFKYNNNIYYITVKKVLNYSGDIDYYVYYVDIFTKKLFKILGIPYFYKMWSWNTYWLDYKKYYGEIDKIINEALYNFENNLKEQKYILDNENKWINT